MFDMETPMVLELQCKATNKWHLRHSWKVMERWDLHPLLPSPPGHLLKHLKHARSTCEQLPKEQMRKPEGYDILCWEI